MANKKSVTSRQRGKLNSLSPTAKLEFHEHEESPLRRLPFVRGNDSARSFWDVPASGDFSGGYDTGEALAGIYINYLEKGGSEVGGALESIARCMALQVGERGGAENLALRGQMVGFFLHIERVLRHGMHRAGNLPFARADADLIAKANAGLSEPGSKSAAFSEAAAGHACGAIGAPPVNQT